ncbi:MAG: HAMP domain-containing histidine kinase [Oscillospiraceae bacterium]|nr:HAMP domain-containing histidine kinase [Oscillospiraceae bacterium]
MRYSMPQKFIAIVLTAIAMVTAFGGILGIWQVAELGLYTDGLDGWIENRLVWQADSLARKLTDRYAVRSLTNCPDDVLQELGYWYMFENSVHWTNLEQSSYSYKISDSEGKTLTGESNLVQTEDVFDYQTLCSIQFPVMVTDENRIDMLYGKDYLHQKIIYPDTIAGKPNTKAVSIRYYESPEYLVSVTINPHTVIARSGTSLELVRMIYALRYELMLMLAISLVVFGAGIAYLCCAAGKTDSRSAVRPSGLNRLPLDVYAIAGGVIGYYLATLAVRMMNYWIFTMDNLNAGTLVLVGLVLLCIALLVVGFVYALCAQIKAKKLFWWRQSLIGRLWKRVLSWTSALVAMLPMLWQYLLIGCILVIGMLLSAVPALQGNFLPLICVGAVSLLVVGYAVYAYGALLQGAEKMAGGKLNSKINTRFLIGPYAKCANYLNDLADVAILAAKNQVKAERMKSELITNVSHDIKTPLTSIINYVDILQSDPDTQAARQYLEVLGRQSQRLKKLVEDLMEMSKASSGNLPVDIIALDPVEAVNQALGEFSDRLAEKDLTVVFHQPEKSVSILADGRLTWRVLSNLLSNITKYALPGTRVYADIQCADEQVLISLKNISCEQLNVSAEELTERFVRGDASRTTEGSGLGLNIAKTLMELQKGQLQLLVDGDLFKATLVFPAKKP